MKKKRKIAVICILATTLAFTSMFSGCGGKHKDNGDVQKITWYIGGVLEGADKGLVLKSVNEKLREKYNMELDLIAIDFGNYDKKMQVINAGRETYDLAYSSSWTNSYDRNARSGAYADITDKLKELAPNLYNSLDKNVWEAAKVDGKIYGVPNWQVLASSVGLGIPTNKLEKVGVNIDDIKTMEDLTGYLRKLHEVEPESNRVGTMWNMAMQYYGMNGFLGEELPGAFYRSQTGKPIAINQYESPEFEQYIRMRRDWVKEGLSFDAYTTDDTSSSSEGIQRNPFELSTYKPGVAAEKSKSKGYEWQFAQLSPAVFSGGAVRNAMTAVSATSKNVDSAVKFLEIINSDKEIFNMLCWGIEGRQYTKVSENQIEVSENNGYSGISAWELGSVKNSYVLDTQPADLWEQTERYNNEAIVSPILGFEAKTDSITAELANCKNVIKAQLTMLELGLVDPDTGIKQLQNDLKTAGADKVIAELQRQIDQWWESKK